MPRYKLTFDPIFVTAASRADLCAKVEAVLPGSSQKIKKLEDLSVPAEPLKFAKPVAVLSMGKR